VLAFAAVIAFHQSLHAQERPYPSRAVTIVHPFAAGGIGYHVAQVISNYLKQSDNMEVVVEAKPGANAALGTVSVARAEPDGHSLLITTTSVFSAVATLYKEPPFDPVVDFTPVALVAKLPLVLVANSQLPIRSPQDVAKLARSTPGGLSYSTIGPGGAQHLTAELLKRTLGIELFQVPYRGPVPAVTAVAGGHVAMAFIDTLNAQAGVQAGTIRAIAVTGSHRVEAFPDVPTFAEAGLAGFDLDLQSMIFAPVRTPREIVRSLNVKIRAAMSDRSTKARFAQQGVQLVETPLPEQVEALHREEVVRWSKLVQDAGLARSQ
jgi:tripartite-type tricarboxylate transporter receptor subunit TctC